MKRLITGILILVLVILVGCSEVAIEAEPDPITEQPAETESTIVEEVIPPVVKGPAEELALEASDIGPGWVRLSMDVKANGNWIDQTFHLRYIKDDLEYTEQVIQIIRVHPDVENALLDSMISETRWNISLWETQLESLSESEEYLWEHLETVIGHAILDLPFWDEAYRANDYVLRKDNIIVTYKLFRMIRRYDSLQEGYTPVLTFMRTLEQEQWLDREQYADDLLYSLAKKARDKISEAIIE